MKKEKILALTKSYEDAFCVVDEIECWSAHNLHGLFGYSLWHNFTNVIVMAKKACVNVVQDIFDHFIDSIKWLSWVMVHFGRFMTSFSIAEIIQPED